MAVVCDSGSINDLAARTRRHELRWLEVLGGTPSSIQQQPDAVLLAHVQPRARSFLARNRLTDSRLASPCLRATAADAYQASPFRPWEQRDSYECDSTRSLAHSRQCCFASMTGFRLSCR